MFAFVPALNVRLILELGISLTLIGAFACSTSGEPAADSGPAAREPTAVSEATDAPAMSESTGGNVNLLVTNIGNGKFDPFLTEGEDMKFQRNDKDVIVNDLYTAEAVSASGFSHVTPNALGWGENLGPRPFDLDKSHELLKSIGFGGVNGNDGTDANGEPVSFTIYTWEAGDLPGLPDLAQLYKDFWTQGLGWDVDVVVGDTASTRQQWNNRELPGDVLVRTNEARYDGTSIAQGSYLNKVIAWRVIDDPALEPWASTTTPRVMEGLSDLNPETRHATYNAMWDYLQEETHWGDGFHTNVPWGLGADIASYEPWSLVPYVTDI